MEKTIKEIVKIEETRHEFYCDGCNQYLGTSYEYDDGWYDRINEYELKLYVNGWIHINKCFCAMCKYELVEKIRKNLFDIGFEA